MLIWHLSSGSGVGCQRHENSVISPNMPTFSFLASLVLADEARRHLNIKVL